MHVKNIHCMIEELADGLKANVTKSMKPEEVKILGETVDMLKDLCEAEYYARISKAMEESEKEDEEEAKRLMKQMKEEYGEEEDERMYRMGYNRSRYANGRFAPRGRGRSRRMGYMPPEMWMPDVEGEYMGDYFGYADDMMPMGYSRGSRGGNSGNRGGNYGGGESMGRSGRGGNNGSYGYSEDRGSQRESSRHGQSYDNYVMARRHFTETKDAESKKHMDETMKEYANEVMDNLKVMWIDADGTLKQSTKNELLKFVQQLPTQ